MRRAFLDSHVAVWVATGDSKLSASARKAINGHSSTVISSITLAELEMKAALGRLPLPENLASIFEAEGITVESFDSAASAQLKRFPQLIRHDPFDRLILAQASSKFGTSFFTSDQALLALGLDWIVEV